MPNLIQLPVTIGTLPPAPAGQTRQEFAQQIADRLVVSFPSDSSTFTIGGSQPTSDVGPWFKQVLDPKSGNSGYELWVWSTDAATYKPLTLNQIQLRYYIGETSPDQTVYDIWVEVDSDGAPQGIYTYNYTTNAWQKYSYTTAEIDAFFEGEDSGKKQVDWDRILNKPNNANYAPRSVSGSTVPTPNYDWEQAYHTDLGQMIVYDPAFGWKTLTGAIGDLKEVKTGLPIGTVADFVAGTLTTVLGRNPGWDLDSTSQGRVIVGADTTEVWDSTTALTKSPLQPYGADEVTLSQANLPAVTIGVDIDHSIDIKGGGPWANGVMAGDSAYHDTQTLTSDPLGSGTAHSNVQKSIAYWRLVKIS